MTATLLPNAKQQFIDGNGIPLAGGFVYFYVPNTSTPKNTWQDENQVTLNSNPIILNSSGEAIIYGSGQYRQVVYDSNNNLIWDALTRDVTSLIQSSVALFCGTSTGSANAQILTPSPSVSSVVTGQSFSWFAGYSSTAAMTITLSGVTYNLYYAGAPMPGNYVRAGAAMLMQFDGTQMELVNPYQLPVPGSSGNLLESNGTIWTSAAAKLPAPGTSGNILTSNGSAWTSVAPAATGTFATVHTQVFTGSGTYTPTTGMLYCVVEVQGGGGGGGTGGSGGGGSFDYAGSGGGAGSYSRKVIAAATVGASQTITVGAGGAGGTLGGTGNGSTGNTSSFGAIISCSGGGGGNLGSSFFAVGGSGGTSSGGDFNCQGGAGAPGITPGNISPGVSSGIGGNGGDSYFGGGGLGNFDGTGAVGGNYGSGGAGSSVSQGGNGAPGIIVITEFCSQ